LPESVGGERNWDYRYTWVRDASLTLQALWVAACPDEAEMFFAWMANAVAGQLEQGMDLQIMFGIGGEHDLTERSLQHLAGWRGSRPVRVGNGAWDQRQLDVYGELLGTARLLADHLGGLLPSARRFLVQAAEAAAARWREQDQGIWEVRGGPRDFLYSKLMCWAALDCAISLADQLGAPERVAAWSSTRDEIRRAILERGWSERAGAFTQSFGSDDLDASALMMPIVGFMPGDDPRMRATIDAIAARLTDQRGLVYRYRAHDGLAGDEGSFLLCTFWLARAQALAGEVTKARATFERTIAYANDVGTAGRGGRSNQRRAARQLPSGFQPHRPDQCSLGDSAGRGIDCRERRERRSRRWLSTRFTRCAKLALTLTQMTTSAPLLGAEHNGARHHARRDFHAVRWLLACQATWWLAPDLDRRRPIGISLGVVWLARSANRCALPSALQATNQVMD
jgi:hypothetical protein